MRRRDASDNGFTAVFLSKIQMVGCSTGVPKAGRRCAQDNYLISNIFFTSRNEPLSIW
jgi:hypothetical protein